MTRKERRAQFKANPPKGNAPVKTADSYYNAAQGLGWGNSPLTDGQTYTATYFSRQRQLIENMYASSGITARAVDTFAEDATRKGIDIAAGFTPEETSAINKEWARLKIWESLADDMRWARLYGGSIGVIMVEGQDLSTPLRIETVRKGQFRGITVLDRWQLDPTLNDLIGIKDLADGASADDMGKPRFYKVINDASQLPRETVHYSRAVRIEGFPVPFYRRQAENLWGLSIVERIFDRISAYDSVTLGAVNLAARAYLRTYKVESLRDIIASGGPMLAAVTQTLQFMRMSQANEGITLMDKTDEFEAHKYAFNGLAEIIEQMAIQVAACVGVPVCRLFETSAKGLNATGEGDMQQYHEDVHQTQMRQLNNPVHTLLELTSHSLFGRDCPEDMVYTFRSLTDMPEEKKAEVAERNTKSTVLAYKAKIIGLQEARAELKQASDVTGVFSNLGEGVPDDLSEDSTPVAGLMSGEGRDKKHGVCPSCECGDCLVHNPK